jgi:hypothetical protein
VGNTTQKSKETANSFSSPVVYKVTSGDGEKTSDWTVTITGGKPAEKPSGGTWVLAANNSFAAKDVINSVAYGGGKFVAGGSLRKMAYSTDGSNWTAIPNTVFTISQLGSTLVGDNAIRDIAYGSNKFVAVGGQNQMAYSADGVAWTAVANSPFPVDMNTLLGYDVTNIVCIAYGGGKFVAGATSRKFYSNGDAYYYGEMAYSTDGITWTRADAESVFGQKQVNTVSYVNGKFVAGGQGVIGYSADGITWTAAAVGKPFHVPTGDEFIPYLDYNIYGIAYGAGKYIAVGASAKVVGGGNMASSTDAATWTEMPESAINLVMVTYANGKFILSGAVDGYFEYSADGLTWTRVSIRHLFDNSPGAIKRIACGADRMVAVGYYGGTSVKPVIAYCIEDPK